jgi:hypothetical protein
MYLPLSTPPVGALGADDEHAGAAATTRVALAKISALNEAMAIPPEAHGGEACTSAAFVRIVG